jgi:hypothetical protein
MIDINVSNVIVNSYFHVPTNFSNEPIYSTIMTTIKNNIVINKIVYKKLSITKMVILLFA